MRIEAGGTATLEGVTAQPGWYADPHDTASELYWDGARYAGKRPKALPPTPVVPAAVAAPPPPRDKQYMSTTVAIPIKLFGHGAILKDLDSVIAHWANKGWTLDKVVELQAKDGVMQMRDRVTLLLVFVR